jgi:hypothetical protein
MNRYLPAAAIATAALCLATACASSSTDNTPAVASTAACEQALTTNLQKAEANPNGPSMGEPAACAGLDNATLNTLARQAMATVFAGMASSTALPTDLPS